MSVEIPLQVLRARTRFRARDGIVEECKRALKDSEFVANNVFVVLAVLAGELKRFSAQVTFRSSCNSSLN